jgi:hypothetical protein
MSFYILKTKSMFWSQNSTPIWLEVMSSVGKVRFQSWNPIPKLHLQLAKLGFNHEIQFPNYIFSYNLNEHYAFCLHLQSRNSFSVQFESLFLMEKNDLGFLPPPFQIMHLGGEEMWSEFAIWACFYTSGEAEALGKEKRLILMENLSTQW